MRVGEWWARTTERLRKHVIADAGIEAEVLLRHAMDMGRADFFAALDVQLDPPRKELADRLLQRRVAGEPLAYILGNREFYGLDFCVNPSVLVPRQETELLVDAVLEHYKERPDQEPVIADVGTGSGAIAIAIARHLPRAAIYATDSSHEALMVADVNRRRHSVTDRVQLVQCDLLEALREPIDVIVSNPPYLTTEELTRGQPEIRREPPHALDGGKDGLDITRQLLRQARGHLRPEGLIVVEIAPQQLGPVMQMGTEAFPAAAVSFSLDLLDEPRIVSIMFPESTSRLTRRRQANDDHASPDAAGEVHALMPG